MAKTTFQNIKLGFFVLIGTVLLIIATYLIGNNQNLFSKNFNIVSVFSNVNGLQLGNNVRYAGINVGTIKSIEMENDTTIVVKMAIEQKMQRHIKKDAIASIGSDGLVGNMIINIIPGKDSDISVVEGDEIKSYSRIEAKDMLSTLNTTNENAALLTAELLKVTQSLTNGKGTFGRLLNDTIMASNLEQTIVNLKNTSAIINGTLTRLNKRVEALNFENSSVGVLLNDTISGNSIRSTITRLEKTGIAVETIAEDIKDLMTTIKEGNGTLNFLATDTIMVNNLDKTMRNLEEGTYRFNENMEALKHNFLFRRYFRKQAKKEQRQAKDSLKNQ
ncbi:MlaD family protein [Ascidiimonas sp. W6]|uniref:MlaD family protein n=1 Tax=Ascidiimonas meishanensis TaxID=3128903 RepID=UPI0030EED5AB